MVSEAPELVDAARRLASIHDAQLVLNKHNCYYDFLDQYLRDKHLPLPVRERAVNNLYEHEQQGISDADVIVFQSEDDRDRFDIPSATPVRVIPNGTNYEELQQEGNPDQLARDLGIPDDQQVCLFVGSFDYEPNHAAARFVIEELSPVFPEMAFLLVGRNPPRSTAPNVYAPGYVTDLIDALRLADIALCPLPRGSGTKLKMLDYFAAGLPVVTTSVGTQGLPIRDGEHALVRDEPTAMKGAIRELARDEGWRKRLAQGGHSLGEQFAWSRLLRGYDELLTDLSTNNNE
ncbi:glycosyltransferase family 4 protein [Halococcus saccharolyticus]|uniref:glycosyltransferase family 4 protein n=1 Tax=Halococcus saccharolyticus TaxID=62319 RepID=UPI00137587AD|nr:glycosyltransferase family 4 protein [Halococcus saccharolyticus]